MYPSFLFRLTGLLLSVGSQLGPVAATTSNGSAASESIQVSDADADADAGSQPALLARTGQCPTTPKPMCHTDECRGNAQSLPDLNESFRCRNTSPFQLDDGRSVLIAGCRCCQEAIENYCDNWPCEAPPGTRICQAEYQQGCGCWTTEDLNRAWEEAQDDPDANLSPVDAHPMFNPSDMADFGYLDDGTAAISGGYRSVSHTSSAPAAIAASYAAWATLEAHLEQDINVCLPA
ncbi:hypothetical protein F4778DRAFT_716025 [Xylariomycetidae sp. FL2044]|nr:hypothetical protein F4778DRAFT_716025 [Xylariomycetidae sp. FL2044]